MQCASEFTAKLYNCSVDTSKYNSSHERAAHDDICISYQCSTLRATTSSPTETIYGGVQHFYCFSAMRVVFPLRMGRVVEQGDGAIREGYQQPQHSSVVLILLA